MEFLPGVVSQVSGTKQILNGPTTSYLNKNNELFILYNQFFYILVNKIPESQEIYRIFWANTICTDMYYMESKDAFILKQVDPGNKQLQIHLILNWRDHKHPRIISDHPIVPKNWVFSENCLDDFKNDTKIPSFLLGCFEPDSEPFVQIYKDTIIIVTNTVAFIWDLPKGIPIFRLAVLLPQTTKIPLFSFANDLLAISLSNGCFVIKIEETNEEQNRENAERQLQEPFTPGTKCFELGEHLNIDCLLTNEGKNSLFLLRSLPGRTFIAKTVFNMCPPGEVRVISSLSDNTFVFLTSLSTIVLTLKRTANEREVFLPSDFTKPMNATRLCFNKDFIILSNDKSVHYVPNPEKCGEHFDVGKVSELDATNFPQVNFVNCNNEYLTIISSPDPVMKADLRILKFNDITNIGHAALKSKDLETRKAAIRLMGISSPAFANSALEIAKQILEGKKRSAATEAVPFLITAFNMTEKLTKQQRNEVIETVKKLAQEPRKTFMRYANFEAAEIDDEILKYLGELPPSVYARKLIKSKKFDVKIDPKLSDESFFHQAICKSISGNSIEARQDFLKISNKKLLSYVTEETLQQISNDLPISLLIEIGRPDLETKQWMKEERYAAFEHYQGKISESVSRASSCNEVDKWHFEEWPSKPFLCKWAGPSLAKQFIAGCSINNNFTPPNDLIPLYESVKLAKEKKYAEGLKKLPTDASPLNYLREFANTPTDWVYVLEQTEDQNIRKVAMHMLIKTSPSTEYREAIKKATHTDILDLAGSLQETDNELLKALSLT